MDCEWELVKIDNDGEFAPGYESIIPETSVIVNGDNITMFARDDNYRVPIMYKSSDNGATWTDALTHDIPFVSSKITSGTLSDGRNYKIGNIFYSERTRLAIFFTEPGGEKFTSGYLIQDGLSTLNNGADIAGCHYPTACEYDGKLIISFTANYCGGNKRGAAVTILDLDLLK